MVEKLWFLIPELWLLLGAVAVSLMGLSRNRAVRDALPLTVCGLLLVAGLLTPWIYDGQMGRRLLEDANLLMPLLSEEVDA